MDLKDSVALAIASQEPRRSAEIALDQITGHLRILSAALYRIQGNEGLQLWCAHGVDQVDLARAAASWDDASASILAGNAYTDDQYALVPLQSPPTALLYLGSRHSFRLTARALEAIRRIEPLLITGLKLPDRPPVSPIEVYLETTHPEQVEREQLGILLRRNEWNVSRVARLIGVSRVTIYNRMQKLRLALDRPPTGKA
jgi:hypothetical protein